MQFFYNINESQISLIYTGLFFIFFVITILLDHFLINNCFNFVNMELYIKFRNMFYLKQRFIFFIIFLFVIYMLFTFNIDIFHNLALNISDKTNDINVGTNSTLNINNPNINASISKEGINSIAAAISSAGGATAGFKVAQYIGGPPSVKIMAGLGTMAVVQATTSIMSRVLNSNNTSSNKFVYSINYFSNNKNNKLNEYPFDLLFEVNTLLYAALLFLFIILNIYLAKYISNVNYDQFIPNNKFGYILKSIIYRYIKIWNRTNKYLLTFSYIMLLLALLMAKFALYIIINN